MISVTQFNDFVLQLFLRCKSVQKGTDEELSDLQNDTIKYVKRINSNALREICVFFADDFLIKKFDWKKFLIEKEMFKSSSGGSLFFERLNNYFNECDYEMCTVCLIAMKIGFTGYITDISNTYTNYYSKFQKIFNIKEEIPTVKNYENLSFVQGVSLPSIIIPFIVLFIVPFLQKLYYIIKMFTQLDLVYSTGWSK